LIILGKPQKFIKTTHADKQIDLSGDELENDQDESLKLFNQDDGSSKLPEQDNCQSSEIKDGLQQKQTSNSQLILNENSNKIKQLQVDTTNENKYILSSKKKLERVNENEAIEILST
jgi:hypothetical protein